MKYRMIKTHRELDEIVDESVAQWGVEAQMRMVVEESAELTQAIMKYFRATNGDRANIDKAMDNLHEEAADSLLCHLTLINSILDTNVVVSIMEDKLDRLRKRLSNQNK